MPSNRDVLNELEEWIVAVDIAYNDLLHDERFPHLDDVEPLMEWLVSLQIRRGVVRSKIGLMRLI